MFYIFAFTHFLPFAWKTRRYSSMYFSNWRPLALISNISLHPVQPLKMTPLRTSICNHTFPQEYISTVLLSSLYAISENFWVQVWFVLTPHWKERGTYYQITQSAFRWLVDLNYYLLDCFDLIACQKISMSTTFFIFLKASAKIANFCWDILIPIILFLKPTGQGIPYLSVPLKETEIRMYIFPILCT